MIHKFKMAGYNIVVDVNSGAVHSVDDLTYDILDNIEPPFAPACPDNVTEKLQMFHSREDIATCYDEVVSLYREGLLFSEEKTCCSCKGDKPAQLRAVCLNISHDCNLRCRYCFAENGSFGGERSIMSADTARKAVDFLIEKSGDAPVLEIYFFGGEPLMNFDVIKDTVAYVHRREEETGKTFRFSLTTNGTLLNDEITEFINREIHGVVLSADGRKRVNDSVRCRTDGTGTYDEIIPKFRKLIDGREGRDYYIRGTFTCSNTDFSEDVFSLLDEGFERISIEPVSAGTSEEFSITEQELPYVFREYDRLAERIISARSDGRNIDFFPFDLDISGRTCDRKRERGCGCGNEYAAVTPEGDIYPCHQFVRDDEMKLGNIHEGTFDSEMRMKFADTVVSEREACSRCWAKFYCSGGCSAAAYHTGGDIKKPHKLTCQLTMKRIECALTIIAAENS